MRSAGSKCDNWLRLLRVPNLFTVPGDPIAGVMLSSGMLREALWPAGAALCFYCAGLLLNDFRDINEDLRDRPERPLPSGAINPMTALGLGILLILVGVGLSAVGGKAALCVGLGVAALVVAYNFVTKRRPILGALNMGACRAGSLLLGVVFVESKSLVFVSALLLLFAYIASVTFLARFETTGDQVNKSLPSGALLVMSSLFLARSGAWLASGPMLLAGFLMACSVARSPGAVTPAQIGALIGVLLPVQAAFCASSGKPGLLVGLILLVLWPVSRAAARRFYAS